MNRREWDPKKKTMTRNQRGYSLEALLSRDKEMTSNE